MKNLIILCCVCLLSLTLHAKEIITIVRGDGNYFPFEYRENGKLTGIHIDLIQAVANELGLTVKFESLPWSRALFDFKLGKYDAMSYVSHSEERETFAYFLDGNIISSFKTFPIVLSRRKNEIVFDGNLTSLTGYTIAVGKNYKYGKPFDTANFLSKYEISTPSQAVLTKLLNLERVDVIVGSRRNLFQVYSENEIDEFYHVFEQPVGADNSYLVFSRFQKKLVLARKFAVAINKYKSSHSYQKLLQYYKIKESSQN
jgi:polar amino acid transport system substrate-binding protein